MIGRCGATQVVIHVDTNDTARKGSEGIAKSILGVAQQAKSHAGVGQVYICSVTARKDLGSFVTSERAQRAERVLSNLREKSEYSRPDPVRPDPITLFNPRLTGGGGRLTPPPPEYSR